MLSIKVESVVNVNNPSNLCGVLDGQNASFSGAYLGSMRIMRILINLNTDSGRT